MQTKKIELCKHHNLPKVSGMFCIECQKSLSRISGALNRAFLKIELRECNTCGGFISPQEYEQGDGACFKCWSK